MEIPSSPPKLATRLSRKRRFEPAEDDHGNSSDFVFSSDGFEPSLDTEPRKRLYKGAWWGHEDAEPSSKTTSEFSRNFDSGVFMANDDPLPSFDRSQIIPLWPVHAREPQWRGPSVAKGPKEFAKEIVDSCVETDGEVVDLSELDLHVLDASLLAPLQSIIKKPRFLYADASPSENHFHSLTPKLQLFLAHNSLKFLPPVVWDLENLTVVSLRHNQLTVLPGSISKLKNLTELNVANNRLRWLPWELLQLLGPGKKLKKLHVRPNPLFQGVQFQGELAEQRKWVIPTTKSEFEMAMHQLRTPIRSANKVEASQASWMLMLSKSLRDIMVEAGAYDSPGPKCLWEGQDLRLRAAFVASSPVCKFRIDGSLPIRETCPSRTEPGEVFVPADPRPLCHSTNPSSGVLSLFELSVSASAAWIPFPQLELFLPDNVPTPVFRALRMAHEAHEEGGRKCTVCSRSYSIPRTEWVEYWHCIQGASVHNVNIDDILERGPVYSADDIVGMYNCC